VLSQLAWEIPTALLQQDDVMPPPVYLLLHVLDTFLLLLLSSILIRARLFAGLQRISPCVLDVGGTDYLWRQRCVIIL